MPRRVYIGYGQAPRLSHAPVVCPEVRTPRTCGNRRACLFSCSEKGGVVWRKAVYFDDGPSGYIAIFSVKTLIFCVAVSAFCAKSGQSELRAIRISAGDARLGVTSCET